MTTNLLEILLNISQFGDTEDGSHLLRGPRSRQSPYSLVGEVIFRYLMEVEGTTEEVTNCNG